jgi:hypothetical protein
MTYEAAAGLMIRRPSRADYARKGAPACRSVSGVSVTAIQPVLHREAHLGRAKALTVRLLWTLCAAVEKA